MTKDEYRERRAAGLCTASLSCRAKPKGALCRKHRQSSTASWRKSAKAKYLAKKLAGQCVITGCKNAASSETVTSDGHRAAQREREATPEGRADGIERSRRCRAARVAQGLCSHCGSEPLETKTLGEKCAKRAREAKIKRDAERARAEGRTMARQKCRRCGEEGHRLSTCLDVEAPMPTLRLEDFMSAPSALASEMSREGGGGKGSGKWTRRAGA